MAAPLRFDHEDAARRHAAGESLEALAADYGVTRSGVYLAVKRLDPAFREASNAYGRQWRTTVCEACGGPATKLGGSKRDVDGRILCVKCRGLARRERLRFNDAGRLVAVRCTSLDCANGERWQRPTEFPGGVRYRDVRTKGIHNFCRQCNTRMRRAARERQKVPCESCGAATHPASSSDRRQHARALCPSCSASAQRRAAKAAA